MGNSATWKTLEDLMIDLKKKGATIPPEIIGDLRSAKLMIKVQESSGNESDAESELDQLLGSIESFLISEAQKDLGGEYVDPWLQRLAEANAQCETIQPKPKVQDTFVVGVPRDQKWVRVEPEGNLTAEKINKMASGCSLSVKPEKAGRLVVYGKQEDIKTFLKQMTAEVAKKPSTAQSA